MKPQEGISLALYTTFRVGGPARFFIEAKNTEDILEAVATARKTHLPLLVLGGGANLLVPDVGVEAVVVKIISSRITFEETEQNVRVVVDAGAVWDEVVRQVGEKNFFGIENLAGIPGTVGGAAVQNIGAYGAELSTCVEWIEAFDTNTASMVRLSKNECAFNYRDSLFKKHREFIILRVALTLSKMGTLNLSYADLKKEQEKGTPLATPKEVGNAVRAIRAGKFPDLQEEGTAGSFFKNPIVEVAKADELTKQFPELPRFTQSDGRIKLPLAWLLDHALNLKGHSVRKARLFERQPLVITTTFGATAADVDALAEEVSSKVFSLTGIAVEREVESFGIKNNS